MTKSLVLTAERSKAWSIVYDCCGATKNFPCLNPFTAYGKEMTKIQHHFTMSKIVLI